MKLSYFFALLGCLSFTFACTSLRAPEPRAKKYLRSPLSSFIRDWGEPLRRKENEKQQISYYFYKESTSLERTEDVCRRHPLTICRDFHRPVFTSYTQVCELEVICTPQDEIIEILEQPLGCLNHFETDRPRD